MADTDHADKLAEHVKNAEAAGTHLAGWVKIAHSYELAFIHALAGAEDKAREALSEAIDEIHKFKAGTFTHLTREISLLEARVQALLSKGQPAKKPAAAKAKAQDSSSKE